MEVHVGGISGGELYETTAVTYDGRTLSGGKRILGLRLKSEKNNLPLLFMASQSIFIGTAPPIVL